MPTIDTVATEERSRVTAASTQARIPSFPPSFATRLSAVSGSAPPPPHSVIGTPAAVATRAVLSSLFTAILGLTSGTLREIWTTKRVL
jgi:hypothetical protein